MALTADGHPHLEMIREVPTTSTWTFKRPSAELRKKRVFVVVTRKDPTWGARVASVQAGYALAVRIDDREMLISNLYQ